MDTLGVQMKKNADSFDLIRMGCADVNNLETQVEIDMCQLLLFRRFAAAAGFLWTAGTPSSDAEKQMCLYFQQFGDFIDQCAVKNSQELHDSEINTFSSTANTIFLNGAPAYECSIERINLR